MDEALANLERTTDSALFRELGSRFAQAGYELALVGGPVRDAFLGRKAPDLDFTTSAKPDEIIRVLKGYADTFWDIGREFGTIGARIGDAEQLTELRRGRAILRHLGLQIRAHAVLTGEHLGEPFGTQLAADAGQGRRIATGIAEIVVTLEIGLTRGVRSAESVAFMAGDAVERL